MIFHADVDAFYASVAQRDDPGLRGRPVIVGSWVVMAASYEARAYGVRGGMPASRARRLCPELLVADPCWESYAAASRAVFDVFARFSPVVEPGSMEEAFLDMSHAARQAAELAAELRRAVREAAGLPLSVGAARTKVLAKMASRSAKPDGLLVVPPEREVEFLHPLPVERIWGVGPATARKLHASGIRTVGQAARLDEPELMAILGKAAGRYVHAIARNHEHRPVRRRRGRRSFGAQRALGRRPRSRADLEAALDDLAERIARRMQRKGRAGRTVVLRLRFADYTRATRSCTLAHEAADPAAIAAASRQLLDAAARLIESRGITLIGLTVTNLSAAGGAEQLELPVLESSPPHPPTSRRMEMPLITKIDFVAIPSRDRERSRAFYVDTVGLRPDDHSRYEFWAGETCLSPWEPERLGREFTPQKNAHLALHVDDVAAARAELEAKGVEFLGDTFDTGVCHMAFFNDPDGNDLMLHHRYAPSDGR